MPTFISGRRLSAVLALVTALLWGSFAANPAGAATPANVSYVRSLYADILDRSDLNSDPGGLEYWADRLETRPRSQIVRAIMFAPQSEYFGFQVQLYFNLYLERTADPSGYTYYTRLWQSGTKSQEDIVSLLVGSSEFYRRAGNTPDAFVTRAYFDILGREPDAGGLAYFKGIAARLGRGSVAKVLLTSDEALRAEVNYKYDNFLERPPTRAELTAAVNLRKRGTRFEALDISLVSSAEYYTKNSAG